jgi:GTP-binding protein
MAIPLVAVVGRPNVGKSTFFNKMAGRRIAIVDDTPGVTRDRIYADCQWQRHSFTLIDTGGIDPYSEDPLLLQMRLQAQIAIEMADAILFLVDGKEGMTGSDAEVADLLRRANKPVLVAVNKIDNFEHEINAADFYELGFGTPHAISSVNLLGFGDLLDELCELLPESALEDAGEEAIKVAVCGKPNVGKSSLVNKLLGEERVMVSEIAGTTRDAIDSKLEHDGREYTIIDTAGIRRKARINDRTLERYSVIRAFDAIRRCDVALLLIDATQGVTEQDTKVAGYIEKEGKACIVVVNKWDSIEKETGTLESYKKQVLEELKFMDYVPVMFISALTGQRTHGILPLVAQVYNAASHRVTTGMLNDAIHDAIMVTPPPTDKGRRLRIFYATQQSVRPPTFVLFTNDPKLMHFSYERYIENYLRKTFPFDGTPIRIIVKGRDEKKESAIT